MLEVGGLAVEIGGRTLLEAISFDVPSGKILSVLGPSGSGKTTLLRALAGLQPLNSGQIRWKGEQIDGRPSHRRGVGMVFQDYALFPHRNVGDNVAFGLRMRNLARSEINARVIDTLDLVGLAGFEQREIAGLSGGEQQRVALARALAPEPEVLLLDEPLGSLDYDLRQRLLAELHELLEGLEVTSLFVTHDQEEAFAVADELMVLRDGRIAQLGRPLDVWHSPVDEWVARFIGFVNVAEAVIDSGTAATPWGTIPLPAAPDGTYRLALRPESITISAEGMPGRVISATFRRGQWRVHVSAGDSELTATASEQPSRHQVRLAIDPAGAVLLEAVPSTR